MRDSRPEYSSYWSHVRDAFERTPSVDSDSLETALKYGCGLVLGVVGIAMTLGGPALYEKTHDPKSFLLDAPAALALLVGAVDIGSRFWVAGANYRSEKRDAIRRFKS